MQRFLSDAGSIARTRGIDLILMLQYDDSVLPGDVRAMRDLGAKVANYHVDMSLQWYRVLRGAAETLPRTRHLLVEAQVQPMHGDVACFDEVCHLVQSAGLSLWMVFKSIRDQYGELLIFDLLFRRSPSNT